MRRKNRSLSRLLCTCLLAFTCGPALKAQTDVTEMYVKNPSFEENFTHWDYLNMQSQTNASFSLKSGSIYVEQWVNNGNHVGDSYVRQTLTGLPNGTYQITAAAQNIQQNTSATQSGAYIFAGEKQTEVHGAAEYTVSFTLLEGQVTIGFKTINATGNWVSCDNFRLSLTGNDLATLQKELADRIEKAQALAGEKMQKEILTELNAAIENARQAAEATTDENLTPAACRLKEAANAAQNSIQAYEALQTAIEKALNAYGDGNLEGAQAFYATIQSAQETMQALEASTDEVAAVITELETASLAFSIANASGTPPIVTTDTRYARGSTMAFGRSTVSGVPASDLLEQGFCWSTSPEPTILDHRTTEYLENNGRIYVIRDLKPSTVYYIRAYAMTQTHAVGYGDVLKVITIPKGTIYWDYDNGGPAEANARINTAVETAVNYWNNLTSIRGLHLQVHYGAQTPTADCSYGGWMRVGPNASYQRTGTIMHEMGHAIGVGTHEKWNSGNTPLRTGAGTGDWTGDRANEVLRFWDNNPTAVMTGDGTHMWPYGINGAHEDNGSEALYIANGLITQALGEDGLPPTGGFSTPAYVFEQEEHVKYYLKSESDEHGLHTAFLTASDNGALKWEEMNGTDAMGNDHAAWHITFNPAKCYYQFRNVATGKYLTYNTLRNQFRTIEKDAPGNTEDFHLMRSRTDVSIGGFSTRGYWLIYPDNTAAPHCLGASTNGRTAVADFNLGDEAKTQRWLILPEEEIADFSHNVEEEFRTTLADMLAKVRTLSSTPHTEDVPGTDQTLETLLADIEGKSHAPEATASDLALLVDEVMAAAMDFLANATPVSASQPFDLTFLLSDAGLSNGDGWSARPAINYSCGEFFQQVFDFNQSIRDLPAGTYQFKGQGFQRPGEASKVYADFQQGKNEVAATIYAGTNEEKLAHIAAEAQPRHLGGSESAVGTNPVKYIPNDMQAASIYFSAGLYDNGVVTQLTEDGSRLTVGIRNTLTADHYWCIFDNFRLYFYGSMSPDQVTGIHAVTAGPDSADGLFASPADIYDLRGICVRKQATTTEGLKPGIYVINKKKVAVR